MTVEADILRADQAEATVAGKVCTKCGVRKGLCDYHNDKRAPDGKYSHCIACHRAMTRAWEKARPEMRRAGTARYRAKHPGAWKETEKRWRQANRERIAELQAAYAKRHPEKIRELVQRSTAKRKAQKLQAMPAWADQPEIAAVYLAARKMTRETGVAYHVDHIVPLISKSVCGLHVPANLQIISASANTSKSNRHWPDMP